MNRPNGSTDVRFLSKLYRLTKRFGPTETNHFDQVRYMSRPGLKNDGRLHQENEYNKNLASLNYIIRHCTK